MAIGERLVAFSVNFAAQRHGETAHVCGTMDPVAK